ncbi:MAG TPA: DUF2333 family protein [Gammaproteobacteria bacterium]|nr:DUF2333 family protein [Gammaproteobacteria bacterium]
MTDEWKGKISRTTRRLVALYHPTTLKEKGLVWAAGLLLGTYVVIVLVLGILWNTEPDPFDVQRAAAELGASTGDERVVGALTTATLIHIGETLLYKRGGYLSNDVTPPGVFMDNIPNWEYGALVMIRDGSAALRNHWSRSQSQSLEDKDLAIAEPLFNFDNSSWILPSSEGEYKKAVAALKRYLARLTDPSVPDAQFFARADNLKQYLEIVGKRLGSLSQRLSASVGQVRVNTDLANDAGAEQATRTPKAVIVKTPWTEIDDVFYEARGASWALIHLLTAIESDFRRVLEKKNAVISLRQIIRELEGTQESTLSPVVLNGSGFGLFSNYSLTMANYISRANAAIIDLRNLLEQG